MQGDFFTKAVQGKLFKRQRDDIMNIHPESLYNSGGYRGELENTKNNSSGQRIDSKETVISLIL